MFSSAKYFMEKPGKATSEKSHVTSEIPTTETSFDTGSSRVSVRVPPPMGLCPGTIKVDSIDIVRGTISACIPVEHRQTAPKARCDLCGKEAQRKNDAVIKVATNGYTTCGDV